MMRIMTDDYKKALAIAKRHKPFVGAGGTLIPNVAKAIAEGIELGRQEALESASKAKTKVVVKEVQNFQKNEPPKRG
jgi:hypothetical protein